MAEAAAAAKLYGDSEVRTPQPRERRDRYEALKAALWTHRSSWDAHWRDLGDYFYPRRMQWWPGEKQKGQKTNQNIIDSTGRFSARTLESGLHAGLTSPARPWMKLTTPDPDLAKFPSVKAWLYDVTERMLMLFAQTNTYNTLPVVYGDLGIFGTAVMSVLEDDRDLFRTYNYPIGSYALAIDRRRQVCTFVHEYEITVLQAVQEFVAKPGGVMDWTAVSSIVKASYDRGDYETAVPMVWMVAPNEQANPRLAEARFAPWVSLHYEVGAHDPSRTFARVSGFRTFPILAPRWATTGQDAYGTDCPGMTALGDAKQLQLMQRRKAQAINKMVDPPLVGPSGLRHIKTSLLPGDVTYIDEREGTKGLRAIHEVQLRIAELADDIAQTQYRIQRSFYEDLFLMLAASDASRGGRDVTAREIDERHEEKLLALGPVLERTNDELLDPLIDRTFDIMVRHRMIPPPPPDLEGQKLRVEYTSIMAQAQKLIGVSAQDRFLSAAMPVLTVFPEARHKINPLRVIDGYAGMLGIDPALTRTDQEAQELAGEEAEAARAQAQAQQAKDLAGAAATAGAKPVAPDSPLDRVLRQAQGAA